MIEGILTPEDETLVEQAREAFVNAYAPYSHFRVGAVLVTRAGTVVRGCNVEDATMNLGVCAERAAIVNAVTTEGPEMKIATLAVVAESAPSCAPCGNCRQLFSEFADDGSRFIFGTGEGFLPHSLEDVLPYTFRLAAH